MRIGELSRRTGITVATIKFYLREGLVPAGERTSATQATYSEAHVDRLNLVRALLGPGGLSVSAAREVLGHYDSPPQDALEAVSLAQWAATLPAADDEDAADLAAARDVVARAGWELIDPDNADLQRLAEAMRGLRLGKVQLVEGGVDAYADWIAPIADAEVATVAGREPADAIRQALLGTVLVEPLLLALRRLAHQDATLRLVGKSPADG